MSNDGVEHDGTSTDIDSPMENRMENREPGSSVSWSPTPSEVDSIRKSIKESAKPLKASLPIYMKGTTAEALRRIAKEQGTYFTRLVEAICDSYINAVNSRSQDQSKDEQTRSQEPENNLSHDDRRFLDELRRGWPNRDQDWRDKQSRHVVKHYGQAGEALLGDLQTSLSPPNK